MGYTVRRWLSSDGFIMDDSRKAETPEEAIVAAVRLAGICRSLINDEIKQKIRGMQPGETVRIKRPSLKFTMIVRRTKR